MPGGIGDNPPTADETKAMMQFLEMRRARPGIPLLYDFRLPAIPAPGVPVVASVAPAALTHVVEPGASADPEETWQNERQKPEGMDF